jgi:hypothetical protein
MERKFITIEPMMKIETEPQDEVPEKRLRQAAIRTFLSLSRKSKYMRGVYFLS